MYHIHYASLLIVALIAVTPFAEKRLSNKEVADQILNTYNTNITKLSYKIRAHYATRMYRVTNDKQYKKHITPYARKMVKRLKRHVAYWDTAGYKEKMAIDAMATWPNSQKNRRRVAILSQQLDMVFYRAVLEKTYQVYSYNLAETMGDDYNTIVKKLKKVKWEELLLNQELIGEYASKLANYINYLILMGIVDLEEKYIDKFKKVFMRKKDSKLTKIEFQNKIYGLTHIILAATGYLQHELPKKKYDWILDYFEENIETILSRTKPDVVAEVGLCFIFCGRKDSKAVKKCQDYIVDAFDPNQGLIPFGNRKVNLKKSEHRNIIAYLLLSDIEKFYPGPDLSKMKSIKELRKEFKRKVH